jgi:protein TonB
MRIGGNIKESLLIRKVMPVYPELAKRARVSFTVILVIVVDEEGNVSDIKIQQGHPLLNDAAVTAVKQWKYTPTVLNGEPVPITGTVNVVFSFK